MRIRQMTAEDIPAVAQIEKECFSQPWSEQGFLDGMKESTTSKAVFQQRRKHHVWKLTCHR